VLALTAGGVAFHQFVGKGDLVANNAERSVVRDDKAKRTCYGLRIPLSDIGLKPGAEFGFNIVLFDDDGEGQAYWLQLAPGLAGGQHVARYPRFVLAK